ncbi:MAG: hypothetical protein Q7J52_25705 [Falsiroseomonas sp.]|nr:hypothetical protein [Falsiroseomonas sp.]
MSEHGVRPRRRHPQHEHREQRQAKHPACGIQKPGCDALDLQQQRQPRQRQPNSRHHKDSPGQAVQSPESAAKGAGKLQRPEHAEQHARQRVKEERDRHGGQPQIVLGQCAKRDLHHQDSSHHHRDEAEDGQGQNKRNRSGESADHGNFALLG